MNSTTQFPSRMLTTTSSQAAGRTTTEADHYGTLQGDVPSNTQLGRWSAFLSDNPAVQIPHLPGHIRQLRQPADGHAHIVHVRYPPQHMILQLIGSRIGFARQISELPTGTDEIDPDVIGPPFAGRRLHQADESGLEAA